MSRKQDTTRCKPDRIPDDLLDRPIACQVVYARATGSITAGLMLGQALTGLTAPTILTAGSTRPPTSGSARPAWPAASRTPGAASGSMSRH